MKTRDVFPVWARILQGRRPFLSIEITKQCPLHCPGCYAYVPEHLGNGITLRQLGDFLGQQLVDKVLEIVRARRPVHVSFVGGEPLLRHRELSEIIPALAAMRTEAQLITSAVVPIPEAWAKFSNLHIAVSVDGLAAEHDVRRAPATYERILQNIAGHKVIVHGTVTRQLLRPGYLREFCKYWSAVPEARKIWFSLYTPQQSEVSPERLSPEDRAMVLHEMASIRPEFPKLHLPDLVLEGYARPPQSPAECLFSQLTECLSTDLEARIVPCQIGGNPVCVECGCMAAAGLASVGKYRLAGLIPLSGIYLLSRKIGCYIGSNHQGKQFSQKSVDYSAEQKRMA